MRGLLIGAGAMVWVAFVAAINLGILAGGVWVVVTVLRAMGVV